ncbi:Disulfide-bond oxidoreductase YfcG [Rhodobacteraceae bacterium THAF1]|uniref:glutathione S-transferase family protein n=1 Tax=Palleronia sp. THAF1 TaxID=2587842 RepID=UPI000F3FABE8|nr:glutathione S-transferase N-terminal domain-containing protein [Palleronia sp. THAF1]QFU09997.1 Disulfide-bond oxidoreductase YfcG [Palleronia sp. THAF1]VDC17098.1 Disulfide-bond oxidoreductase YfcG [Rhodobacteraceae bacterium THAF1]
MTDLSAFPITRKWPAEDPSVIQLYSFPTPNGVKASIMLEEVGLPYEAHLVKLGDEYVKSPEFLSLNPNNKIPAMIDPNGPDGPIGLWESHTILTYLAEKTGKLGGTGAARWEVQKWLSWQVGGLGPMFGQFGHFVKLAKEDVPYGKERYTEEAKRLLGVIDRQLERRAWVAGDYSIADIAIAPWLNALAFYEGQELVGWDDHTNAVDYVRRFYERPAVQKGKSIPDPKG